MQDKHGVVSNKINISMRRDVCLRTQCECATRTLSSWALSAGILVSLSKRQFADFDTADMGCNEGLMDYTSMFAEYVPVQRVQAQQRVRWPEALENS